MCAIAGLISSISEYYQPAYLNTILKTMHSRGPDGTGIEILGKQGCFGHNRLAIIDVNDRAKQPIWDSSRRFCLSFNGEIYNFQSLRQELIALGHHFRTRSDTEVLIQAWLQWGISSVSRFVGMFAFAVWDKDCQKLYLVRDRMGEKPLYYAPINQSFQNGIIFASELKALLQYPFIKKNISMTALNHYLSFNYTSTQDCIFENIHKLPPASFLEFDLATHEYQIKEYWSLAYYFNNKKDVEFDKAEIELNALLKETIKDKLISDVPLGAFLSGGIDSAIIVNHMRQGDAQQVNTYSIGFNEATYNELEDSHKTAHHFGVNHQTEIVTFNAGNLLSQIIYAYDEPFADTSLIPTYLLCAFAKKYVTVSLSGDGGDELFGGYITYQANRYHQYIKYLPVGVRKLLLNLSEYLPTSFNKISLDYKIKHFLKGSLLPLKFAHLSWREIFNNEQKKLLFQDEFFKLIFHDPKELTACWFKDVENCHFLDQAMYVDMKTWLVDDILVKVDRASMAHSLEVRAPFLDHRLVEFAAKIPPQYKIRGNVGKHILKTAHAHQLPRDILRAPKRGFNSPVSHWLSCELYEMAYDVTTSNYLTQWFNKKYIEKLWFEHRKGLCDNGHRLFNLLCLGLWYQNYMI